LQLQLINYIHRVSAPSYEQHFDSEPVILRYMYYDSTMVNLSWKIKKFFDKNENPYISAVI